MSTMISHREMRNSSSEVLRRVEQGEELTVTNHGRPVARIVPIRPSAIEQLLADGRARPALSAGRWRDLPPALSGPITSEEVIADLRGYDREY